MKRTSESSANHLSPENCPNSLPLKSQAPSSCRLYETDCGTDESDYLVLVLVKSIMDYYLMSKSFSRNKAMKSNTKEILESRNWIKKLPVDLFGRLRKESSEQETIK